MGCPKSMEAYGCLGLPEQGKPSQWHYVEKILSLPHVVLVNISSISKAGGLFQVVLKAQDCDHGFFPASRTKV